jgi:DNA polymerase III delta prime subunit
MDIKEYTKEYYEKEYLKEYRKQYYENNKQQIKEYYENNKEKISKQKKVYRQTEQGKKSSRIIRWQQQGIIFFDWDLLYEIYINTEYCELCGIELTEDKITTKTTRCLDHDHSITDYDNVRNIVCHSCNVKRGS